jgi:hypothetical protein
VHGFTLSLILLGGCLAGIVNTVAGGGSIITLPLLIFAGLPAPVANATNRIAIVFQNVGALTAFRRHGLKPSREAWLILIPSLLGGGVGVILAIDVNEALLRKIIGAVLVLMLVPILRKTPKTTRPARPGIRPWMWPVYFLIGVYGGFLQVGVGFLYLGVLVGIQGLDLVRANLHKVFYILAYSALAVLLFAWKSQVHWSSGLVLAVGNAAGGWLGAKLAVERGERWIRVVLVVAVFVAAGELMGVWRALGRVFFP